MIPKISVIMPMYNVEKYVGCAIQSLLDQTFTDFEAILVDDCSTDSTLAVAKSFNDPRVKIFVNERNSGAAETRNIGMSHARGKYIYFFDSDDAILPNALKLLYDSAEKFQTDISMSINCLIPTDNEFQNLNNINFNIQSQGKNPGYVSKDFKTRIIEEYSNGGSSSGRFNICKREFLQKHDIRFEKVAIHEDGVFFIKLLCATDNIIKFDNPFYIYRGRKGSLTHPMINDYDNFARYIDSYLTVMNIFEKILIKAMKTNNTDGIVDFYFIDNVCMSISQRAFLGGVLPYFQTAPAKCWEVIDKIVSSKYGENSVLMRRFIYEHFIERINNHILNSKSLILESKLKSIKDNINKLIP